ncbi:AAA family ATPase [Sulfidibacter corallicola]|uniref:AAA family ATPase n=1 Tax=Sulfidibacter corallicola TaxID=2818388 RepID=A0A8A4TQ08_SULCO|nr:AAA family ATPase [Sulfidibacter corallicola]QTD51068.1 AAA family ATPase [Sulfidibacter corallicola]
MRIDSLRLQNFKGFDDQSFSFGPTFNLLIGDNGSGKTAILDALTIAIGSLFLKFADAPSRHIRQDEVRLKTVRWDNGQGVNREPQYPVVIGAHGHVSGKPLEWERRLKTGSSRTDRIKARPILNVSSSLQKNVMEGKPTPLPVIAYYGTGRLWLQKQDRTTSLGKAESRLAAYSDSLDPASNEKQFIRWFIDQEFANFQNTSRGDKPDEVLGAIKRAIQKCLPGCESFFYDGKEKAICAQFSDGRNLPIEKFSDGERNMMGMIADLGSRCCKLNPFYGGEALQRTEGIVLIDEIDLHLHPNWQRRVVGDLKRCFPKVQFIATTHSPFIIQALNPTEDYTIRLTEEDGALPGSTDTLGIEDIAEIYQGVENPQRSRRYFEKIDAAERYFEAMDRAKNARGAERQERIAELNQLMKEMELFGHDPAFQAALRLERRAQGLGDSN